MDAQLFTNRKFKRMFANILSILLIVVMIFSGGWSPARAAFPGDNGKIAFVSNRDSNFEIYIMESDGSNQTNITNNPAYDGAPSWSPDGSQIVFMSERDGNYEIYRMNADGTDPIRLTTDPSTDVFPNWSPDGSQLVFAKYDLSIHNYDIWRMNSDGTGAVQLTDNPTEDMEPVWSPDGTKILFHSDRDGNTEIYVMNPDGTDQMNLTNNPAADGEADWSPDGSKIVFASTRDNFGAIWVMNADGSSPTRITDAVYGDGQPSWSPDGTKIVFKGFRDFNDEIYVMNADGTDITRLTNNAPPGNTLPEDWFPDWQPGAVINSPWLRAFPDQDFVDGSNWPAGQSVSLQVGGFDFNSSADSDGHVEFNVTGHDLVQGDTLSMWSGEVSVEYTARQLYVTDVNLGTQTVAGTVDGQQTVHVWTEADELYVESDADGNWSADFSAMSALVLYPGVCGNAEAWGEQNDASSTIISWCAPPPTPHIEAFAWYDRLYLVDWPTDVQITITVQNPDYQGSFTPDGSSNVYDFFPGVDLQPGSVITATNGDFTKILEISPLSAMADAETGNVSGIATPDRTFHMRTDGDHFPLPIEQDITSEADGNWSVTIDSYLPWRWLTRGEMWEGDEDGDVTYAIWHVHNEIVEVWLSENEIRAFDWPLNTELTFNVDGNDIGTAATEPLDWIESASASINAGDLHLQPGMTVTVTDGSASTSTIVQDIKITHADTDQDLVYGYAPSNASIELRSWEDIPPIRFFNAEEDGSWTMDYRVPNSNGVTVDVNEGDTFTLFLREPDKDSTVWQWNVPWSPSTYTVNTTDDVDDGTCDEVHCSLREAINAANAKAAADTIEFNIPGDPPFTIQPQSGYPDLQDIVTIDATTQPGFNGAPLIELDGTYAGIDANGFVLSASDSTIKGLVINRFAGNGIVVFGSGNTIQGNYIGSDVTGTTTTGQAGPAVGEYQLTVMPETCTTYPTGTNFDGFISESEDALAPWSGTSVQFKGTEQGCADREMLGAASLIYRYKLEFAEVTQLTSISVFGAAFNGPDDVLRVLDENMNVLGMTYTFGGNSFQMPFVALQGVEGKVFYIDEFDTSTDWRFRQNIVINGPLPIGNHANGVLLAGGATDNTVIDNLISGNISNGVAIFNPGTTGNVVQENYIGADVTGMQSLGNAAPGVGIGDQAYNNFIIENLISGNKSDGVAIFNPGTNGNTLQGNTIGIDATGMAALPNAGVGVWIGEGASDTSIGGTDASVRNVISGNKWGGISINHAETTGTRVQGNYIGTNKNGDTALPNGGDGVYISGIQSVIGGSESGAGNLISGNTASGITLTEPGTSNIVQGNYIGTDVTGTTMSGPAGPEVGNYTLTAMPETCPTYPVGTDFDGFVSESEDPIAPWTGTSVTFRGTDECADREMLGASALIYRYRLEFAEDMELTSIAVSGAAFNGPDNVLRVLDEDMNVLGSVNTFGGNSFQTPFVKLQGVIGKVFYIDEFDTSSTWRYRQHIVINGPVPLGNLGNGVSVANTADNTIERNLISGNMGSGIGLFGGNATGNLVRTNLIGTNADGTAALPNGDGVWLGDSASNNIIGGTTDGERNLISGNSIFGVSINNPGTMGNVVQGNYIGTDIAGTGSIPNAAGGVILTLGTSQNHIGGTEPGAGNVISGNNGDGVTIVDTETSGNLIQGNLIGTDATGTVALGNQYRGVYIAGGAHDNFIGGTEANAGNLISANGAAGIRFADFGTTGNKVQGNLIGSDITGMNPLGNGYVGIRITDGVANNMIGGTTLGSGNIIVFNAAAGVAMTGEGVFGNTLFSNSMFSNGGLGIDLNEDDVTLNDEFDPDTGPNELQNFPVISHAIQKDMSMKIHGLLVSLPSTTFRLEFFSSNSCDPSGYGEGQTFLGSINVTTNADGNSSFRASLPISLLPGTFLTATATDSAGNTSEFSQCYGPMR